MPDNAKARRPHGIIARTLIFGTSALLAAGLLTWSPSATTGWNQGSAEATLWQLLNGARTNNGMAPLQQHGTLVGIARWRSQDMLDRDYFSHTIPGCGCLVYTYYDSNGLSYVWAGENIGWNSGHDDASSPVQVHEKFMASAGHRANVLTAAFTHGAVGAAAADNRMFQGYTQNTRMYTELFLQAPGAAPAPPPVAAPAPAPAPPPSGGGGGGGGGSGGGGTGRLIPGGGGTGRLVPGGGGTGRAAAEPTAQEMTVTAPVRPTSATGLDGIASLVIERPGTDLEARLAADDALGIAKYAGDTSAEEDPQPHVASGMQVSSAGPASAGLFDRIVGALLGFLFG